MSARIAVGISLSSCLFLSACGAGSDSSELVGTQGAPAGELKAQASSETLGTGQVAAPRAIQVVVPPSANYVMTARKRVYYKIQTDAQGASKPVEVYTTHSYVAGDTGSHARVGHYSSFGPNGVIVTVGIEFDYWVEESYYIFNVSSEPLNLESRMHYVVVDTSHFFGETPTANVDLVQLPWNVFEFYDLGHQGNAVEQIVKAIAQADRQPAVGGEPKGVILANSQVGKGTSNRFGIPLDNLLVIRDTQNNPLRYSYGVFAIRVNTALDFSACGGIQGYTLTEDPTTLQLSLSDQNGNPVSGFDQGVVLNFCVNGWTTPGYGFRVDAVNFDAEIPPTEETPICNLGILAGHNSTTRRSCAVGEEVKFFACQGNYGAVLLREPLAALGGTPVSYWTANKVVNLRYLVDWGDGTSRTQIGSCSFSHQYSSGGSYAISVIADFDVEIYDVLGRFLGTEHKSSKELGRETIIMQAGAVLGKQAMTILPMAGDVDGDASVDINDVSRVLAEIRSPTSAWQRCDVNGDGTLNIADARKVATLFSNPRGKPNAPAFPQTLNGRYVAEVVQTSTGSHYQIKETQTGAMLFTTHARFDTPNDVKAGLFSANGRRLAAAYHYGNLGPQTWIGLWEIPTGKFLGFRLVSGYLRQLPADFSTEGFNFNQ